MHKPDRIIRADVENLERDPPELTPRELEQYNRILLVAEAVMAQHGIYTMTISSLAHGLRMGAATLRRHFSDLDMLLATLLRRHLRKLAYAVGKVPNDVPNRPRKMRAAYLAYTRIATGGLTEAHLLLVRDRHLLPDDLRAPIEATRRDLGGSRASPNAEDVLGLLDLPNLDAPRIEAALASIADTATEQPKQAAQAPKPTAPVRCDRIRPATPPWAPRDPLALLRFGPLPVLPNLPQGTSRLQIHSSA